MRAGLSICVWGLVAVLPLSEVVAAFPTAEEVSIEIAETGFAGGTQGDVQVSPDGKWVAFTTSRGDIQSNTVTSGLEIRKADGSGAGSTLPSGTVLPRWSRDGALIAVALSSAEQQPAKIAVYEFHEGTLGRMRQIELAKATFSGYVSRESYAWSPSSRYLAIVAPLSDTPNGSGLDARRGVADAAWQGHIGQRFGLFVYDVEDGSLKDLTPADALIAPAFNGGVDWSPDERKLVVSLDRDTEGYGLSTKLAVLDLDSRKMTDLVTYAGKNSHPLWSPDGSKILLSSQGGVPDYSGARPAVVDVQTGKVAAFPSIERGKPERWSPDGRGFLWSYDDAMTSRVRYVSIRRGSQEASVPTPGESDAGLFYDTNRSYSADGKVIAYTRSSFVRPSDAYVAQADSSGHPVGSPRRLTHFSDSSDFDKRVTIAEISWPSRDLKFQIHGLLARPASSRTEPLPTLLYLTGGPGMVRRGFDTDGWTNARLALAAHGYAVLVPNTRGRNGYGDQFLFGIRDGHSYAEVPLDDALAGVDYLIGRGIADPHRLAIAGHSYGGFLTAYAITRVQEFKAAVINEAHLIDLTKYLYPPHPQWRQLLARDLYGVEDPYDPSELKRLIEESPGLHAAAVRTPALLLFGAKSCAKEVGEPLFYEYQHFNVPSEFFVYDEEHTFTKPSAVADSLQRTLEWLDRWVLDQTKAN